MRKIQAYTTSGAYICTVKTNARTRSDLIRALREAMIRERVSTSSIIRLLDFDSRYGGEVARIYPWELE